MLPKEILDFVWQDSSHSTRNFVIGQFAKTKSFHLTEKTEGSQQGQKMQHNDGKESFWVPC